jgi:hypothetical protein
VVFAYGVSPESFFPHVPQLSGDACFGVSGDFGDLPERAGLPVEHEVFDSIVLG